MGKWVLRVVQLQIRDELLNGEIFYTLKDALRYQQPAPETVRRPPDQTANTPVAQTSPLN
jgi:hypothetical protein